MSWKIAVALVATVSLNACVYHIDSAIPDGQATLERGLVGTWVAKDDTAIVAIRPDTTYRIEYRDSDGERMTFRGRTGRLGDRVLLEIVPSIGPDDDGDSDWPIGHMPIVVTISPNELRTDEINIGAIRAAAAKDPVAIPHIRRGDDIILTAPTERLVPFLRDYVARPGTLEESGTWKRVVPGPPASPR